MRAATIQALRDYYAEGDDATTAPVLIGSDEGIPYPDPQRIIRLLLRALREIELDRQADKQAATAAIQDLRQRVTALEQA